MRSYGPDIPDVRSFQYRDFLVTVNRKYGIWSTAFEQLKLIPVSKRSSLVRSYFLGVAYRNMHLLKLH
jgi:hypothetical protein